MHDDPLTVPSTMLRTHATTIRRALPSAIALALLTAVGCPGDPEPEGGSTGGGSSSAATTDEGSSSAATTDEGSSSAATTDEGSSSAATTGESASTDTGSVLDCGDATDEASCAAAMNNAEGGGCTWMRIHDLTIDSAGTCTFTESGTGECVGTHGLDDGCNEDFVCDDQREVYFRSVGDAWKMTQGTACRGVSGFESCWTTDDEPCTCACELP